MILLCEFYFYVLVTPTTESLNLRGGWEIWSDDKEWWIKMWCLSLFRSQGTDTNLSTLYMDEDSLVVNNRIQVTILNDTSKIFKMQTMDFEDDRNGNKMTLYHSSEWMRATLDQSTEFNYLFLLSQISYLQKLESCR